MGQRFSAGSAFRFAGRRHEGLSGMEGKPYHPPLTDIPIGAYVIAPILDAIAFFGRNSSWGPDLHTAAGYTLLAGVAASLLAAATGLADWRRMKPGSLIRKMANTHALIMLTATGVAAANVFVRFGDAARTTSGILMALSAAVLALVVTGGMIGGSLVYDHGYRVRTAPTTQEPVPRIHARLERRAG